MIVGTEPSRQFPDALDWIQVWAVRRPEGELEDAPVVLKKRGHRPGMMRLQSGLAAPEGRVSFAGSDLSYGWNGWMEGALETGARAAAETLRLLSDGKYP